MTVATYSHITMLKMMLSADWKPQHLQHLWNELNQIIMSELTHIMELKGHCCRTADNGGRWECRSSSNWGCSERAVAMCQQLHGDWRLSQVSVAAADVQGQSYTSFCYCVKYVVLTKVLWWQTVVGLSLWDSNPCLMYTCDSNIRTHSLIEP